MSDRDRISKLGAHIQSAITLASQLDFGFLRKILMMALMELVDTGPEYYGNLPPADVPCKKFNWDMFKVIGSWDWDLKTDRLYTDMEITSFFGVPVPEAEQGTSIKILLHRVLPDDLDRVIKLIDEVKKIGGAYRATYKILSPDGEIKHILAVGRVILDEKNGVARFPGTIIELQDIDDTFERCA